MISEWRLTAADLRQDSGGNWHWDGVPAQVTFRYIAIESVNVGVGRGTVYASWDQTQPTITSVGTPDVSRYQGSILPGALRSWDTGISAPRKITLACPSFFEAVVRVSDEPFSEEFLPSPPPTDSNLVPVVNLTGGADVGIVYANADGFGRNILESSTPIGSNATFLGAARYVGDSPLAGGGVASWFSKFRAMVYADQGGTLNIQQSRDHVIWRTTVSQPTLAGVAIIIESLLTRRYVRVTFVNGPIAQAVFELDSALVPGS